MVKANSSYSTIRVISYHLNEANDMPARDIDGNKIPCRFGHTAYGCGYTLVNGEYVQGYPYTENPKTLNIETEYLPNVVPFETNPADGFNGNALRTQAIAARTYAYYFVDNPEMPSYDVNNSVSKQYFQANGKILRIKHSDSDAAINATSKLYLALPNSLNALFSEFGADHDPALCSLNTCRESNYFTVDGGTSSMISVYDPITNGEDPNPKGDGHGHGLSQQGAKKWDRGFNSAGIRFPFWNYDQILAHYYTGVQLYNDANTALWGNYRWNALKIDQSVFRNWEYVGVNVIAQNSGVFTWEADTKLSAYWMRCSKITPTTCTNYDVHPSVRREQPVPNASSIMPGNHTSQGVTLYLKPPSALYLGAEDYDYYLQFDMRRPSGQYFKDGSWHEQEWKVEIANKPPKPVPSSPCSTSKCVTPQHLTQLNWSLPPNPDDVAYLWRQTTPLGITYGKLPPDSTSLNVSLVEGENIIYLQPHDTTPLKTLGDEVIIGQFLYDPTPPILNVEAIPLYTNATALNLTWSGTDALSGLKSYMLEQQIESGAWAALVAETTAAQYATAHLANNTQYTFRITARDHAGNITQRTVTTTIDRDPPSSHLSEPNGTITKTWALIRWNSSFDRAPIVGYTLDRLVQGVWVPWRMTNGIQATILAGMSGQSYALRIRATDAAGNSESAHAIPDIEFTLGTDSTGLSQQIFPLIINKQSTVSRPADPYPVPNSP